MGELLQYKLYIQGLTTAAAFILVLYRPWTAPVIYLYGYALPYVVVGGRAPLVYPELSLGIPMLLLIMTGPQRRPGIGGWLATCSVGLVILMTASNVWGADMLPLPTFLGMVFLLAAGRLFPSPRHIWWVSLLLAVFTVLLSLYYLKVGSEISTSEVFDVAAYEVIGDRNYNSFQLGVGAIILWCLVSSRVPGQLRLAEQRWVTALARIVSALGLCICGWAMLQFQSRGLTLALMVGVVASLLHRRFQLKYLVLGCFLAALAILAASRMPAYGLLVERWHNADVATASDRVNIWHRLLDVYLDQSLLEKLFGMGAGTVFANLLSSSHNSFLTIFAEQGILGMALLLGVLWVSICEAWKRKDELGHLRFGLLAFCAVGALSIEPHVNPIFWLALALALPLNPVESAGWEVLPANGSRPRVTPRSVRTGRMPRPGKSHGASTQALDNSVKGPVEPACQSVEERCLPSSHRPERPLSESTSH